MAALERPGSGGIVSMASTPGQHLMNRSLRASLAPAALFLGGCAASHLGGPAAARQDCGFRSATTCWTLVGRFPARPGVARDSLPADPRDPRPVLLASRTDTLVAGPDARAQAATAG
jgi:hypothetical protein